MSTTLSTYLKAIRSTLEAALSIRNFASQMVERHNKPEVEAQFVFSVLPSLLTGAFSQDEQGVAFATCRDCS